jgi:hypothetical protein
MSLSASELANLVHHVDLYLRHLACGCFDFEAKEHAATAAKNVRNTCGLKGATVNFHPPAAYFINERVPYALNQSCLGFLCH